jgi:hypothetical protein
MAQGSTREGRAREGQAYQEGQERAQSQKAAKAAKAESVHTAGIFFHWIQGRQALSQLNHLNR